MQRFFILGKVGFVRASHIGGVLPYYMEKEYRYHDWKKNQPVKNPVCGEQKCTPCNSLPDDKLHCRELSPVPLTQMNLGHT